MSLLSRIKNETSSRLSQELSDIIAHYRLLHQEDKQAFWACYDEWAGPLQRLPTMPIRPRRRLCRQMEREFRALARSEAKNAHEEGREGLFGQVPEVLALLLMAVESAVQINDDSERVKIRQHLDSFIASPGTLAPEAPDAEDPLDRIFEMGADVFWRGL